MATKQRVLAVAMRSTGQAMALFVGGDLITARVSRSAAQGPYTSAKAVLAEWLKTYTPSVVIFEDHRTATRKGPRQRHRLRHLPSVVSRFPAKVTLVDRRQHHDNAYQEAQALAKRFPSLADRLPRQPQIWESEPHFLGLFEAVALGLTELSDDQIDSHDHALA